MFLFYLNICLCTSRLSKIVGERIKEYSQWPCVAQVWQIKRHTTGYNGLIPPLSRREMGMKRWIKNATWFARAGRETCPWLEDNSRYRGTVAFSNADREPRGWMHRGKGWRTARLVTMVTLHRPPQPFEPGLFRRGSSPLPLAGASGGGDGDGSGGAEGIKGGDWQPPPFGNGNRWCIALPRSPASSACFSTGWAKRNFSTNEYRSDLAKFSEIFEKSKTSRVCKHCN